MSPLDLHVLGTPPAFVLSQDQTLSFNPFIRIPSSRLGRSLSELTVVLSCVFSLYRFQGSAPLARSLYILSNHPRFVKPFLPFFRDFLNILHCSNVYNYSFVFIRPFPALCPPHSVILFDYFQNIENFSWLHIFSTILRFII